MKLHQIKSWGIDIGNVIFRNLPEYVQRSQKDYSSEEVAEYLKPMPEALNGIKMLVEKVGQDNVWIISKAGEKQIAATRLAFEKFKICNFTGMISDQILFVPGRQDKSPVIKALELEGHIDDRGEIIHSIQKFVKCPLWFCPDNRDSDKWARKMNYSVRVVSGWKQLMEMYK